MTEKNKKASGADFEQDLKSKLEEKLGDKLSTNFIKAVVSSYHESVIDLSNEKGGVTFVGFGVFEKKLKKGRSGKVPGTDKTYTSKDKHVLTFKAGKKTKESIDT